MKESVKLKLTCSTRLCTSYDNANFIREAQLVSDESGQNNVCIMTLNTGLHNEDNYMIALCEDRLKGHTKLEDRLHKDSDCFCTAKTKCPKM